MLIFTMMPGFTAGATGRFCYSPLCSGKSHSLRKVDLELLRDVPITEISCDQVATEVQGETLDSGEHFGEDFGLSVEGTKLNNIKEF